MNVQDLSLSLRHAMAMVETKKRGKIIAPMYKKGIRQMAEDAEKYSREALREYRLSKQY